VFFFYFELRIKHTNEYEDLICIGSNIRRVLFLQLLPL